MSWETVIGLEIHVQLNTNSKIFSGASTSYGSEQNTNTSLVDLGYPGVLPVLNKDAVMMAIKFGLAIDAEISRRSIFARKNYFYPDLPKGYQISQYELPIVQGGSLEIKLNDGTKKVIGITRAHLEEDAGKSIHDKFNNETAIDLNRAGTPLLEIVSEPDIRSAEEASSYMQQIHQLVRYLKISDGNMQEGSFRCDANVSVRPSGQAEFGTRAEVKNINSFRFVENAINYEVERQIERLENGNEIIQETRLYDPDKDETRPMRSKEEANDYRYFPDPDLLPLEIDQETIDKIKNLLPELFEEKVIRYTEDLKIKPNDAEEIAKNMQIAEYFEATLDHFDNDPQLVTNWILSEVIGVLNRENIEINAFQIEPTQLASLLSRIEDNTISSKIAKNLFNQLLTSDETVDQMIKQQGLEQITDEGSINEYVAEVLNEFSDQKDQYLAGKEQVLGFLVGQVMKRTQGKANPKMVNELIINQIKK
ncbi:MAG: Asp-tRNA(Asn)/Glu-tRNA(Gln) amidotransferase subunit GatB [Gammaproteobacteria bacterium]|nr:Asp-tRNA(Asn)/Glu-tRNA(Gln) amidotransferase GatCAB subunit B [Gammaproteobacteria bacterium]MDC0225965.1 Asp-tRNA(Asn)/Glu-tRNA(Gln) amidotransferase subunit GatB [Gammaproteobacteria bacterium]RZO95488.1 MAG: Asp-tRNA(Asn)/Glu-tRNA(Gln) amidotransferase subunit GatB [Gammaproteobacteria bacterium]|tara:strand:- start:111 stop:1547 length:1437 start_codon:yes stop_codon:yes gene_type:complete